MTKLYNIYIILIDYIIDIYYTDQQLMLTASMLFPDIFKKSMKGGVFPAEFRGGDIMSKNECLSFDLCD